ncbi:MAG: sulfurtransferase TusA family protein [Syntrophobacteraceae bacterium]
MSEIVDARGLSCPQPVLLTMNAMKSVPGGGLVILVDTDTARENVIRAVSSKGWKVSLLEPQGTEFKITINRE